MKYFNLDEFKASTMAWNRDIDNSIPDEVRPNIEYLVDHVLDPLREAFGAPIIVTSGYRCPQLNKAVGGAPRSAHMKGMAADITAVGRDRQANARLARLLQESGLPYDQLILYETTQQGPLWLHIGLRRSTNRFETLTLNPLYRESSPRR